MTGMRDDFLSMARTAADLMRAPEVAAAWERPSALPEFGVSGLAGHLSGQVFAIAQALAGPVPEEPVIPVLEHYARSAWVDAGLDADINVGIRRSGEERAADGPAALAARVDATIAELAGALTSFPDRPVRLSFWGPWSLTLDDMLTTRMMEIAVHADDLAVSVGVPTPEFPGSAVDTVIDLLSRLSVRRHGAVSVLRALSRAERAPAGIAAF